MKQIVLLLAFLLSVSCHRRPLEDPANNTTLRVAVNIKAIMNITCDIYNEKIPVPTIEPEMMRVLFYDRQAKKLRRKRTSPTSRMTMKEHVACKAISAYAREPTRC